MNRHHFSGPGAFRAVVLFALLAFLGGNAARGDVYVTESGSDTSGTGSENAPFATLERALQTSDPNIIMATGQYVIANQVVIPSGTTVSGSKQRGNFADGTKRWGLTNEPTVLLLGTLSGQATIVLESGAKLQWVKSVGGFHGIELNPGSELLEVTMYGGQFSAAYCRNGNPANPALIDRCMVDRGGAGIRVDGTGCVAITETVVQKTLSRGLYVAGTGSVSAANCVFQGISTDAIAINANPNVVIENCVIRRNVGAGVNVYSSTATTRGCLIERNDVGVRLEQADGARVDQCTIATNRRAGIYVRNAQPDLRGNIITDNKDYGVQEDKPAPEVIVDDDGTTITIVAETHVGALEHNLFWSNQPADYLDEGENVYTDIDDINNQVVNVSAPVANMQGDPKFVDLSVYNYRLLGSSPAIDQVASIASFTKDLEGLSRDFDFAGKGNEGTDFADIGAYEYHSGNERAFGTEYYDESMTTDPNDATQTYLLRKGPEWQFTQFAYFDMPDIRMLPGRMRLSTTSNNSFGALFRWKQDYNQDSDKVIIFRPRIRSQDSDLLGLPYQRLRVNGPEFLDVAVTFSQLGTQVLVPYPEGTDYELIADLKQGAYRLLGDAKPEYEAGFSLDVMDFFSQPFHAPIDLTHFDVEQIDRTTWDAKFTKELRHWGFDTASEVDWKAEYYPQFNTPRLRYNGTKHALELSQSLTNTFGGWKSPGIPVTAGKYYKIDFKVASDQALADQPWFRFRTSTTYFELSQELIITPFASGLAGPTADGQWYTLYGYMPQRLADEYGTNDIELVLYMDLFGFASDRDPHGTIWLEEVTLSSN